MKKRTLQEMNEQYKNCPVRKKEYVINGKKCIVFSHFIGTKNVDKIIYDLAFQRALEETSDTV